MNMSRVLNVLKWTAFSLVLIGALNWGLIGAFNFNLVSFLFGEMTYMSRIVYLLVGLCALFYLILALRDDSECTHYNC